MSALKPIRTDEDLDAALSRIEEIFDAEEGTPEDDELGVLLDLVELYENKHYPIGPPTPIAAIEFAMDQRDLTQRDLVPYIGSRAKVSEVLSGKRAITMAMARALHQHLGIPAEALLQGQAVEVDDSPADVDWQRFPLKAMAKLGWIPDASDLKDRAEEFMRDLVQRAGGQRMTPVAALFRKNDRRRVNAKTDTHALMAWCWQALATAKTNPLDARYEPGVVTPGFLRETARLSVSEEGPRLARDFLAERGIAVEIVPHLPRTHLDGAALRLDDGRPVIGLSLRYDRIDNFWFCLLHELVHVGVHLDANEDEVFVDDHSLRGSAGAAATDSRESQADEWAEEALIPPAVWEESTVREEPTPMAVINLAQEAGVHPAVVAGRVRHERGNFRLLSQFVGTGQVRQQFEAAGRR